MTCIIGSKAGWMVADRRVSFDGWIGPYKVEKICRAPGALIGVSGNGAALGRVRDVVAGITLPVDPDATIRQLVALMREIDGKPSPAELLIVTRDRLVQIDPSGAAYDLEQPLWAIGCGCMSALSWLHGYAHARSTKDAETDPEYARRAIGFVSTIQTAVGDGEQTEWLAPSEP